MSRIDGRIIAENIKENLKKEVISLRRKNKIPHLFVILIGNNPSSLAYIKQKKKTGEEIGVKVSIANFPNSSALKLKSFTTELNHDPRTQAITI